MKKFLTPLLFLLMFACNNNDKNIKQLQDQNDSLITLNNQKDKEINDFVQSLNQIQENLELIKETEKIVTLNAKGDIENKGEVKERIQSDLQLIYQLMQTNRKTLSDLSRKLNNANFRISEFAKTIEYLSKRIEDDSLAIENLKDELGKKNIRIIELETSVDTLIKEYKTKTNKINEQTEKLNTAYYVFGTEKELKEHKILTKEGGFIGIGKNAKVMENFDKTYFTKIDITKVTKVKLYFNKAKLITAHPKNSFKFEMEGKKISYLVINDYEEFWSISKYLVIVVDN